MRIERRYPHILTVAAVICGVLAAYPAAAVHGTYERTPSENATIENPITFAVSGVVFNLDEVAWQITTSRLPNIEEFVGDCFTTTDGETTVELQAGDYYAVAISRFDDENCAPESAGGQDLVEENLNEPYTIFAIGSEAAATGIFPTLDFPKIADNTASVIGQGWPVAGLAAGIPLGLGILGWIVRIIARRRL